MAHVKLARFAVRPEARDAAERAMHALAARVRELPNTSLTIYRVGGDYLALVRGDDPEFAAALYPHVHGTLEFVECELVTSSDLQRRHRRR